MTKANGIFERLQPFGHGKTLLANEADVEQCELRRPVGDHIERFGHVRGGPHRLHAKPQNRVFEIERNDWIVFNDQDIVGQAVVGGGFHVSRQFKVQHLLGGPAEARKAQRQPTPVKAHRWFRN